MFHFIEDIFRKKELDKNGLYVGEITEGANRHRALICLIRGFVIFLGTFGTLIGLLQAFNLPYNAPIVTVAFFITSMYMSFLYYNKFFFYAGYFALLGGFTFGLVYFYMYANSGYQAIINEIYSAYSDYLKLLSVREGQEFIEQRQITVTVAIIFVGIFLAMLLNVTISGYMNIVETVLVTLPFFEVAFFIGKKPPIICLCMVLSMYIFVGILQASRSQRMQVKGKYTHEFLRFSRKNHKYYAYQGNAFGNLLTIAFSMLLALLIGLIALPGYRTDATYIRHNPVRTKAEEYVKIYLQTGFTGLFDRYSSTGGLNSGHLGGVGEVRPDFETDLSVSFAPYTFSTVYLKSFTGSVYRQNQWFDLTYEIPTDEDIANGNYPLYTPLLKSYDIKNYDKDYLPEINATARMNVVNIDADPYYSYLPYFTDFTKYNGFAKSPDGSRDPENGTDITYSPNILLKYDVPDSYEGFKDEGYEYYVKESCTEVPIEIRGNLRNYIRENNFFDSGVTGFTEEENVSHFKDVNDYRLSMARKIYAHYVQNFEYTMAPGTTPLNRDYTEYFLTTQRRGFCAHFASAGVMLLRSMGIPARYAEGYCIPTSLIAENAIALDENYEDWYEGDSLLTEEGVINVEVNDSYAHAWIEIYMDGYGFVPFEMTIPSSDEEEFDAGGFSDLFSGVFGNIRFNIAELPDANAPIANNAFSNRFSGLLNMNVDFNRFILPFLIMIGVVLLGLGIFLGTRAIRKSRNLKHLYNTGQYRKLAYIRYTAFTDFLSKKPAIKTANANPLPEDVHTQLNRLLPGRENAPSKEEIDKLFDYIERTLYSDNPGSKEEYDFFESTLDRIYKCLKHLK